MIRQCARADHDPELLFDVFAQEWSVPEALFLQFLVEKLLYPRRDQGRLSGWALIRQPKNPTLGETRQVVVNRLMVATKVLRQLGDTPPLSVKPQDICPEAGLRVRVWTGFQRTELVVIFPRNRNTSSRPGHA